MAFSSRSVASVVGVCAIGAGLLAGGCSWLPSVTKDLMAQVPPTYLYFTNRRDLLPGAATALPPSLVDPESPVIELDKCGIHPIIYENGGFNEQLLYGNWISKNLWLYLWRNDTDVAGLDNLKLISALRTSRRPIASIRFTQLKLETLDTAETSYGFILQHPTWVADDYVRQLTPCVEQFQNAGLYIVHHTLVAHLKLQVRNIFGVAVKPSRKTSEALIAMGFVEDKTGTTYETQQPWTIGRTSRLKLSPLGVFRVAQP